MKRGITINLLVLSILLVLFALPWIAMFTIQQVSDARGCQQPLAPGPSETCQSLYSLTLLIGYGMIAYYPVVAAVAGLYLLGLGVFFLVSLARSRQSGQPFSPAALGMIYSSLAALAVVGLLVVVAVTINWYRVDYVSACRGLPGRPVPNGRQNGRLALGVRLPYPQGRPEQFVIWSLSPDGGAPETLAKLPGSKDPAWSPDGREIAFIAQFVTGAWGLYRISPGDEVAQGILFSDLEIRLPHWFPDGARLLFDRPLEGSPDPQIDLFSLNLGDSKPALLVSGSKYDGDGRVSPDGRQVVFTSLRNGRSDVYRVNADGTGLRRLTLDPAWDDNPAWSPDGKWIVFASSRESASGRTDYALYTMSPDGKNQCRLTDLPGSQARPVWSADGQWIAFISVLDNRLYRIRPDGTDLTAIPVDAEASALLSMDWGAAP